MQGKDKYLGEKRQREISDYESIQKARQMKKDSQRGKGNAKGNMASILKFIPKGKANKSPKARWQ